VTSAHELQLGDYRLSFFSLARCDGGVSIDMTDGCVGFDWAYVPFGEVPAAFASYVRRMHFRNGLHVDGPLARIAVPAKSGRLGT
jgi:hypothetical protein